MKFLLLSAGCALALLPGQAYSQVSVPPLPPPPPALQAPAASIAPATDTFRDDLAYLRLELDNVARRAEEQATALAKQRARLEEQAAVVTTRGAEVTYDVGLIALQRRTYESAIASFSRVIAQNGARADAATYWKAFAEYKLARLNDASATLASLTRNFPKSRYLGDANALDAQIKRMAGQSVNPEDLNDDEMKLLAIQGLQRTQDAVRLLEGVLTGSNSLAVKKRALYVLALDQDARARSVLLKYAKGTGTPDLQIEAIRYITSGGDRQALVSDLREIYRTGPDAAVKRAVVDAFRGRAGMVVFTAPRTVVPVSPRPTPFGQVPAPPAPPPPPAAPLMPAVKGAASSDDALWRTTAQRELLALYQQESDNDLRRYIVSALAAVGGSAALQQIIDSNETDPAVRMDAIRSSSPTADSLVSHYERRTDRPTRMGIIAALAREQQADALVALARKETNRELKTEIVRRLSTMASTSKAAADYLAEVIR